VARGFFVTETSKFAFVTLGLALGAWVAALLSTRPLIAPLLLGGNCLKLSNTGGNPAPMAKSYTGERVGKLCSAARILRRRCESELRPPLPTQCLAVSDCSERGNSVTHSRELGAFGIPAAAYSTGC
jgi:hypothetical protein